MRRPATISALLALFPAGLLAGLAAGPAGCRAEPDDVVPPPPRPAAAAKKPEPPAEPCKADQDPVLTEPFTDDFDRTDLGPNWHSTSYGAYFVKNGRMCIAKPRNHPLWLKRRLPTNVKVEFDAVPLTASGDVKAELFGDGCSFDRDGRDYTATSYVAVLGAHANSEHWLARMFEHGTDAKKTPLVAGGPTIANSKLIQGTSYRVELARTDGKTFTFKVNGVPIHEMVDDQPLTGAGHDHFGFNGWDAPSCFDRLTITPLP